MFIMFCKNCGKEVIEGNAFCNECGTKVEVIQPTPVYQQPAPVNQQPVPVNQQSAPVNQQQVMQYNTAPNNQTQYAQPQYAQPVQSPKKNRHTGRWIFLTILLVIIGFVVYLFAKATLFSPKDLGIRYTQQNYNDVIQKLGIHITADLGNGVTYDNKDILAGDDKATGYMSADNSSTIVTGDLDFKDYNWEFSKFVKKTITLTDVEATAFFNEIAPSFWWFKDTQVKIMPDGTIVSSSSADIDKMKRNLFSDVANLIPMPLPSKVNLSTDGSFSVIDNKIVMDPKSIKAGPVEVPKTFTTGENLNIFSSYLERFYTIIPQLNIVNAGVKDGQFVFDGTIPTEIKATPKN